jgi:hypothetical protein
MKKLFAGITRTRFIAVASAFTCLIAIATAEGATQLKEARVTQVVSDVKLLPQQAAPRPAAVNDPVRHGTAVRTGTQSRSELTFTDLTITRLGANTIFSFNEGTREMTLTDGAILFQVPKGSGGATIKTSAVTAAITGTTGIGEFHPATTSSPLPFSKWLCLEGTFHLYLANGQSVELGPGKMVTTDGKSFSKVVDFDIGQLIKTSLFFTGFDKPLASLDLIVLEEQKQLAGGFVDTTTQNPLDLTRIVDVISQAAAAIETAIPSEFGAPSVISSPVPYVITSGTVITTDPTITTNGVTDFGKIWRGTSIDGPLSAFIFGSTSAFDTAIGVDTENVALSGAVFKFTSLELTGNPTVLTKNGQINLALIGVNGITSGGPGGTLTFAGISALLLATQDGSINLGPEISFSGLHDLIFYARGAGSNLTLASAISATIHLALFAEGNIDVSSVDATLTAEKIKLFAGDSITLDGGVMSATATNSSGDVNIIAGNDISITHGLEIDRKFGGQPSGLNVTLNAGNDLSVGGDLSVFTDMSNLSSGGNIMVLAGGNFTVGGSLSLETTTTAESGEGGNIDVDVGGSLSAGDIFLGAEFAVQFPHGSGENVTLRVGNNLIAHNAGNSGGIDLEIITPVHEVVAAGANLTLTVGGNLMTDQGGDTRLFINNNINEVVDGANISATVGGNVETNNLLVELLNDSGSIDNGGTLTFDVTGNLAIQGEAFFLISNRNGRIGSDATINVNAANISTGSFFADIVNTGGAIGGNATINLNVAGTATVTSDATFEIFGSDGVAKGAAINFNGGNYDVGGTFFAFMDGNGTITFNNASVHANVLQVGALGTNGVLNIGGGALSADTTLELYAGGSSGTINFKADVTLGGAGAKILAANSVTIFNNVTVTIGGSTPADVYTNNANYTGSGGNSSTTGKFSGLVNNPQPLSSAPPFGPSSPATVTTSGTSSTTVKSPTLSTTSGTSGKTTSTVINVSSTEQLLALLEGAVVGPGGKITIPASMRTSNWRNFSRMNAAGRFKADRDARDIRRTGHPVL